MTRRRFALVAVAALLASAWWPASPSSAASPAPSASTPVAPAPSGPPTGGAATWGIQPSGPDGPEGRPAFEYDEAPGATIDDIVGVSNFGEAPLTVALYATDAFNTDDGGFALLTADQVPTGVGSWVVFPDRTYTIPPHKRVDVPFQVRIPQNAEPGDHAGGIVASVETRATDANGNGVLVDRRVGTRIYLHVSGDIHASMTLEDVRASYDSGWDPIAGTVTVSFTIHNTGNVRLAARQRVGVAGPFGWGRKELVLEDLPDLLPGSSVEATTRLVGIPPLGPLTADVHLAPYPTAVETPTAVGAIDAQVGLWAWPILLAGILLLLAELAGGVAWWRKRSTVRSMAEREHAIEAARAEGLALGRAQHETRPPAPPPPGG